MDVEFIRLIVGLVLGLLTVPFVDWVKDKFNWEQGKALLLVGVVSFCLASIELFASGQIGLADFTWDTLAYTFTSIFAVSQIYFRILKFGEERQSD
jgi:uncharacterized membrane-anchored protein YitT (DUF2179 family)